MFAGHAVGRVLDDRAGVHVEVGSCGLGFAEPLDQLGPSTFEEGETGLRGQVPREGEAEAEGSGVVDAAALGQELHEEFTSGIGDPVDLPTPARADLGVPPVSERGTLPAQGPGQGCRRSCDDVFCPASAPDRSRRVSAG